MAYNKKEVLQANTEAIRVVLRLEKERREATEAEKSILRNYQGFGGLKCVLNRTDTSDDIRYWSKSEQNLFEPTQQLKQMIYRETLDANTAKRYWESIKASGCCRCNGKGSAHCPYQPSPAPVWKREHLRQK